MITQAALIELFLSQSQKHLTEFRLFQHNPPKAAVLITLIERSRSTLTRRFGSAFEIETPPPLLECAICDVTAGHRLAQSWRVEKRDDDDGLGQPPTANSSFSRITLNDSGQGNTASRSGVIAWRNSLISVRQSSSVNSRGHSVSSGSQQVIGSIPSSFPLLWGFDSSFAQPAGDPRPMRGLRLDQP